MKKLLAQATGEYTREELNKVAKLGWTDKAAAEIAAAKAEAIGGGSNSGGNDSSDGPTNDSGARPGGCWLHFAVRPKDNRRRIGFIKV